MSKPDREYYIALMLTDMETGKSFTESVSGFVGKCRVTQRTLERYWSIAKERYQELITERQRRLADVGMQEAEKRLKSAIKSKADRVLLLQKQVEDCAFELEMGVGAGGAELDTYEKVALRKTIRELQAEISKIEGDYAATKQEVNISGYDIIIPGEEETED